ncbi:glycosyltransferase [candidate division KSB1 bacterium]|nr:glycosyltransferase [candidate division KSB1 bacterium]
MNRKPLHILYVHRTRGERVEGVHIKGIASALEKLGHSVSFISAPGADIRQSDKSGYRERLFKKIRNLICDHTPQIVFEFFEIGYNLLLYYKLHKHFKRNKIDLIYERYALNTFATTLFARSKSIPIFHEINDATGIDRVRKHKAEIIARYIESKIFKHSTALITISSKFREIIIQKGIPAYKISVSPNAVDETVFDPVLYNGNLKNKLKINEQLVIGFIGSFEKWHGLEIMVNIVPHFLQNFPDAHFIFIGNGFALPKVKNDLHGKGLEKKLTFIDHVPHKEIPEYLKIMDVGIIPNSNIYGSPMKLFEYMSMEVVSVVPDLPPILEIVRDQLNGIVFKRRQSDDLLQKLLLICQNKALRQKLGRTARKHVLTKHLWKYNANQIIQLYQETIESPSESKTA